MYRVEFISREIRCELWTFYSRFQWGLERAAVLCPWRCLDAFKGRTFSLLAGVLPDGLLRAGEVSGRPLNWGFIIPSFCRLPLPPYHGPTPLPHTLGCQVTAGNSYPLSTPVLLTFLCEVCRLCVNDAETLSSGPGGDGEEDDGGVKPKGVSMLPLLSIPTTAPSLKLRVPLYSQFWSYSSSCS